MGDHHYSESFDGAWAHIGPWMNYNNGFFSVLTFTTTQGAGLILVSFLTAFIAAVGSFTWSTACFIIHQWRAHDKEQDGQHHQEQVLLRNSSDDKHTMWEIIKVGFAWKTITKKSKRRTLVLLLVAFIHFAIFAVAANLSSRIYISNNDVLIRSDENRCGLLPFPPKTLNRTQTEWRELSAAALNRESTAQWALTYARQCSGSKPGSVCHIFPVPTLNSTATLVKCPFSSKICASPNAALRVESDYINTAKHLGINTREADSLDYKRVTTCAPLNTAAYRRRSNVSKSELDIVGDQWIEYYLGNNLGQRALGNVTFRQSVNLTTAPINAYPIEAASAYLNGAGSSTFDPISDLRPAYDADLSLISVTNNVFYTDPVNDLFYNASYPLEDDTTLPKYTSLGYNFIMGCTEQHQLCRPGGKDCTPLTGIAVLGTTQYKGNALVAAAALWRTSIDNTLADMVTMLGSRSLLASTRVPFSGVTISVGVDANFWIQEVVGWQQFILANLQRRIVNIAAGQTIDSVKGPDPSYFTSYMQKPLAVFNFPAGTDVGSLDLCKSMRTVDAKFTSVHVVGIAVTVAVGVLLILLDLALPAAVGSLQKSSGRGLKRRRDWLQDHVVHLQRHAFEKNGAGGVWAGREDDVPTTGPDTFHSLARHASAEEGAAPGKPAPVHSPGLGVGSPVSPVPPYSPGARKPVPASTVSYFPPQDGAPPAASPNRQTL